MTTAWAHAGAEAQGAQQLRVHIRPVAPTDRAALLAMFDRCSRATRLARWLGLSSQFPTPYLDGVLACSPDHIAIVGVIEGQLIGLASAALTLDGTREVALLVEDRHQGAGIGMKMLDALVDSLGMHEDLCADALFENRRLLRKLARYGTVRLTCACGVCHACVARSSQQRTCARSSTDSTAPTQPR
jgi:GNAT superfamily N-acetyltransferase